MYRGLLRFDLPTAVDLILLAAKLRLYQSQRYEPSARLVLDLYGLTGPWQEQTVTWATQPGRDPNPSSSLTAPTTPGWMEFSATPLVRAWLHEGRPNFGLILRARDESRQALSCVPSRHYPDGALWPDLWLCLASPPWPPEHQVVTKDLGEFATSDDWQPTPVFDTSGLTTVSAFILHAGGAEAQGRLMCSFDGNSWCIGCAVRDVAPGPYLPVAPRCYARYLRVEYRSRNPGQPGRVRVVFQGTS